MHEGNGEPIEEEDAFLRELGIDPDEADEQMPPGLDEQCVSHRDDRPPQIVSTAVAGDCNKKAKTQRNCDRSLVVTGTRNPWQYRRKAVTHNYCSRASTVN
ncbi:hypothetical protein ACFFQF_16670 [Haladaptatus pallidirubidus]|uniref:Uncharacterized protein n=1 Tax=Haladaptatus pallidirubidus TaxID=1008152 RepID=A0AAV3UR96_9EURY|nr:hypothetical protein [Haladaptatus pallidirubidus]